MTGREVEVAVVGGGAAGIAAARRLHDAGTDVLLVEARARLGGRSWTDGGWSGLPLDLGCGWLHSADRNPWVGIAEAQGRTVDRTTPPWNRRALRQGFSREAQADYQQATAEFHERLGARANQDPDFPVSEVLQPGNRWNPLLTAVGTYISGAEYERMSGKDLDNYADTGTNWRIAGGYGTTIAAHAAGVPVALGTRVRRIDHSGPRIRIETESGTIEAGQTIVTLPTTIVAREHVTFTPTLPEKVEAAAGLPLGHNDKLFLSLEHADEFAPETRLFGDIDRAATATYHIRPFGRPVIEGYFGGTLAADLEQGGADAFFQFALEELTGQLGSHFAARIKPIRLHPWGTDPYALGAYSYALPGKAGERAVLAKPVDGRLFFAGEACSERDYSTAHGAYLTGIAAADAVLAGQRDRAARRPAGVGG